MSILPGVRGMATVSSIETVGVIGLGSMGHGVAQLCAQAGYKVVVQDASEEGLQNGLSHIEKSLKNASSKKVAKGLLDEAAAEAEFRETLMRIEGSVDLGHVTDNADLVIEAIIEDQKIKTDLFERLGKMCKDDAIIATNTSSFSVAEMAAATGIPDRVCGLHYFNPVQVMKLVEIVKTEDTAPEVITAVSEFVSRTGKTPVHCGDTAGFIVNRLLIPYLFQGIGLLARGVATPQDIDTAMELGAGHPMGPICLADYVGHDILKGCIHGWLEKYPDDPSFMIPEAVELIDSMCEQGLLGRKTGQGFYKWEGNRCIKD